MKPKRENMKLCIISVMVCLGILVGGMAGETKAAEDKIKIGVFGPMKFPWGTDVWVGASAAAEEINAAGGVSVGGKKLKIELINADDNCYVSTPDAVNAVKRLITVDKVNFLIGGGRTEAVLAQMEIAAEYRKVFMTPGGGAPVIHEIIAKDYDKYKYLFNDLPNAVLQSRCYLAMVDMAGNAIRKELGIAKPKVALLMEKAKWADSIAEVTKEMLPKIGYEVCGEWRPSAMANDTTAELTAIKAAGAHIIYQVFTGPVGVIANKQVGELKIPACVVGVNYAGSALGDRYWSDTNGMCEYEVTQSGDFSKVKITGKTKRAADLLAKKKGGMATVTSFNNYDNVYLLKEAIERAGTLESDAVVVELVKKDYVGTMGRIVFNPKGHKWPHNVPYGPKYITFVGFQWLKGELMPVWPDGRRPAFEEDRDWEGLKYDGTVDFKLSPRVITYWKNK